MTGIAPGSVAVEASTGLAWDMTSPASDAPAPVRPRFAGLSRRIYVVFLLVAVIPTGIAGLIGITRSQSALKQETLRNLEQEVAVRTSGVGRFFDQFASELLNLAASRSLGELVEARRRGDAGEIEQAVLQLEKDYTVLARYYPHFYYIRFIGLDGREMMRVKRRGDSVFSIPHDQLQDKSERYYFHDALKYAPGEIYVSPMDLNIEYGKVEQPEHPVVRLATPIADRDGGVAGLLVANLHAAVLLEQLQEMAAARAGTAYLIDRAGSYLARSSDAPAGDDEGRSAFRMLPIDRLAERWDRVTVDSILASASGTRSVAGRLVTHATVATPRGGGSGPGRDGQWLIAMDVPERDLFFAVADLHGLYAVLVAALLVTAAGGYALSRHLLGPLDRLTRQAQALAGGDLTRRVEIGGRDEIAALGAQFNRMAEQLQAMVASLAAQRDRLEDDVRARTRDLDHDRAFLAAVIENSADGILAIDEAGRVTLANPAALKLLGIDGDPVGEAIVRWCHGWPETARAAGETGELRRSMTMGAGQFALAVRALDGDGGYIVVLRDVGDERRLEAERRELDHQMFQMDKLTTLGELSMGLAHEIGNPLAGMKAVAQALQHRRDITPPARVVLARLEAEVDRLARFLRTFDGFAAPPTCRPEPCALAGVLEDVLFWTAKEARSHGVAIAVDGVETLPRLHADPNQLKQLLLNLVINAVRAMPEGGRLTITAGAGDGSRVRIDVADTGRGIAPDVLPHIFEPFFTTRADGSGLGLAIVRKIVDEHGARIAVASAEGGGTTFTLFWPIASADPAPGLPA